MGSDGRTQQGARALQSRKAEHESAFYGRRRWQRQGDRGDRCQMTERTRGHVGAILVATRQLLRTPLIGASRHLTMTGHVGHYSFRGRRARRGYGARRRRHCKALGEEYEPQKETQQWADAVHDRRDSRPAAMVPQRARASQWLMWPRRYRSVVTPSRKDYPNFSGSPYSAPPPPAHRPALAARPLAGAVIDKPTEPGAPALVPVSEPS